MGGSGTYSKSGYCAPRLWWPRSKPNEREESGMGMKNELRRIFKRPATLKSQAGKAGYILLWLLGVPIPILLVIFLMRGCT